MNYEVYVERLFSALITGDRQAARSLVTEARTAGVTAEELSHQAYWPVLEMVSSLHRADQLTNLAHHYATRLLRALVDQNQGAYTQKPRRGRSLLMFSGASEADELSGMMMADLAEADGYNVFFGGGGISYDEILSEVGERRPDVLLMFASGASDAPTIRQLIDTIREVGACPNMQIAVGGGVFNRAEGLAEEIGADLWAISPQSLLEKLCAQKDRRATPEQRTVGRKRRDATSMAA